VYGLDHRAMQMLADERMALLQREMSRSRPARRGAMRQCLGLRLVSLGFRLAGPCAPPRQLPSS
jgi:hypothetical protein